MQFTIVILLAEIFFNFFVNSVSLLDEKIETAYCQGGTIGYDKQKKNRSVIKLKKHKSACTHILTSGMSIDNQILHHLHHLSPGNLQTTSSINSNTSSTSSSSVLSTNSSSNTSTGHHLNGNGHSSHHMSANLSCMEHINHEQLPPSIRFEMDQLELELLEGDITQKGYDKKKAKLLASYLATIEEISSSFASIDADVGASSSSDCSKMRASDSIQQNCEAFSLYVNDREINLC